MADNVFRSFGPKKTADFSLRELGVARARFSLLQQLFVVLRRHSFAEIRIKDLCRAAEVSEPSFYNYFPEKDDILNYFVSLWSIELELITRRSAPGLTALKTGFMHTAKTAAAHPRLMKELLAYQARSNVPRRLTQLTPPSLAEKTLAFGLVENMDSIPSGGIRQWLSYRIRDIAEKGEFAAGTDLRDATITVGAVFFGVAGLCAADDFRSLQKQYIRSLDIVINGLHNDGKTGGRR